MVFWNRAYRYGRKIDYLYEPKINLARASAPI
jgi:hypothetical protein